LRSSQKLTEERIDLLETKISHFMSDINAKVSEILMDDISNRVNSLSIQDTPASKNADSPYSNLGGCNNSSMEIELPETQHKKNKLNYNQSLDSPSYHHRPLSTKLIKIYKKKPIDTAVDSSLSSLSSSQPKSKLAILWKGKIIRPSYRDLRDYHGNLDHILASQGGDIPSEFESKFKKIQIPWKNYILWASPRQLLLAEGDLNKLDHLLKSSKSSKSYSFRQNFASYKWGATPRNT